MCMCKGDNGRRKMSVHYIAVINSVTLLQKESSKENVIVHDYFTSLILLICDLKLQTSLILCYVFSILINIHAALILLWNIN